MARSYLFRYLQHYYGLLTDLGLIYWIGFRREKSGIEDWERTT